MWYASAVAAYPSSSPSTVAPRASALSAASSSRAPDPSPITKPSRRASNGSDLPVGDRTSIAWNELVPSGVSAASEAAARTASASPDWIVRSARPMACPPVAQARVLLLLGGDPADPGPDDAPHPVGAVGRRAVPAGFVQGLLGSGDRQLGEPVGAPHLLLAHDRAGLEVTACGPTVGDPRLARDPAIGEEL